MILTILHVIALVVLGGCALVNVVLIVDQPKEPCAWLLLTCLIGVFALWWAGA